MAEDGQSLEPYKVVERTQQPVGTYNNPRAVEERIEFLLNGARVEKKERDYSSDLGTLHEQMGFK